mgnify:FL=1
MKKKLLYISNFEAPYRVPFFNLLGDYYDMTLALSQNPEDRKERNKAWFQNEKRTYRVVYLKTTKLFGVKVGFGIKKMLGNYDLVFMDMYSNPTNMYAIWCMNRMGKQFVMSVDGMLPRDHQNLLVHKMKSYFLNSPTVMLSPGKSTDMCLEEYGVSKSKIVRYPFTSLLKNDILSTVPTRTEKFELRKKLGMPCEGEDRVILTVGRFSYARGYGKGYDILFKVMSRLPKTFHLYIVGDEPTQEFIDMKREGGLDNVHFVGFMNKKSLSEYYKAADLFCLQTRKDIWGLVVNEAMSNGLPVITSNTCVAGLTLVEDGVNGYIACAEDDITLEKNISAILNDEYLRKNMSEASLRIIREWTIENMANCHIESFDKILYMS